MKKMPPKPNFLSILITVILLLTPTTIAAFVIPRITQEQIASFNPVLEDSRFIVVSNLDIPYKKDLAVSAEKFASDFTKLLKNTLGTMGSNVALPRERYRIHLVLNLDELSEKYNEKYFGDLEYNDGFYDPIGKIIVLVDRGSIEKNLAALRHEIVHLVMDVVFRQPYYSDWSLWLAEGLAVYYENYQELARQAAIIKTVQLRVNSGVALPIRNLVEAGHENFRKADNEIYYFQSFAFAKFLMDQYPNEFTRYFFLESQPGPANKGAFEDIFGASFRDIEKSWVDWLRKW